MDTVVADLVMVVIEALSCDLFFETFVQERYPKKRWIHGIMVALFTLTGMIQGMLFENFVIKAVIVIVMIVGVMLLGYQAKISRIFFYALCYDGILWGMDLILVSVYRFFSNETLTEVSQKEGKIVVLWIFFKLLLFLLIIVINRKFSKRNYQLLQDDEWIRFLFVPFFSLAALMFILKDETMGRTTSFFLSVGLVGMNVMLFYLIRDFTERMEKSKKEELVAEQRNNQIEQYESMELSYQQQRKKVHEFKNHLSCIQGLLQDDKGEEALKYVKKINNLSEQHMNYFTTSNPVIDVVINQKYQQAQETGISMVAVLKGLKEIPMEDKDLVVLLSNLFNNAIEACRKLKKEKRQIKFKFVQEEERIILTIRNPIFGHLKVVDNKIETTKKNTREHGIGLRNIEEVIERYQGESICETENNVFSYTVIFNKKEMTEAYEKVRLG